MCPPFSCPDGHCDGNNETEMPKQYDEPPTLPLPPTWRLIVAALAIVGFLYAIYRFEKARETEPPPPQQGLLSAPAAGPSDHGRPQWQAKPWAKIDAQAGWHRPPVLLG